MKKRMIFLSALFFLAGWTVSAQTNLVADGSFEELDLGYQCPRIVNFGELGSKTQTVNPASDEADIERGQWYRRASNTAYLQSEVVNDEAQDGEQALKLTVAQNSPQEKLDNWYANTLVQFLKLANNKEYQITVHMKEVRNAGRVYVGLLGATGSPLPGSKWADITSDWKEYTFKVKTKGGAANSSIIFGLPAIYGDNDRTTTSVVLIDNVQVTEIK